MNISQRLKQYLNWSSSAKLPLKYVIKMLLQRIVYHLTKWFKIYSVWEIDKEGYVIKYTNKSDETKDAVLFGFNEYNNKGNYGNHPDVSVEVLDIGGSSASEPPQYPVAGANFVLRIGIFRMAFNRDDIDFVFANKLEVVHTDANGKQTIRPFLPLLGFDVYQQQRDIIDMTSQMSNVTVDANTSIFFKIKANSSLMFVIYGKKQKAVDYYEYQKYLERKSSNKVIIAFDKPEKVPFWVPLVTGIRKGYNKIVIYFIVIKMHLTSKNK